MSTPYGVTGCRCWADDSFAEDHGDVVWQPSAHCPYHGLLPRERMETGEYRVVTGPCERHPGASTIGDLCAMCTRPPERVFPLDRAEEIHREVEAMPPAQGPECPPGVHSMFDFCPGGCLNEESLEERLDEVIAELNRRTTEQKECGVLATVRRWIRYWLPRGTGFERH